MTADADLRLMAHFQNVHSVWARQLAAGKVEAEAEAEDIAYVEGLVVADDMYILAANVLVEAAEADVGYSIAHTADGCPMRSTLLLPSWFPDREVS